MAAAPSGEAGLAQIEDLAPAWTAQWDWIGFSATTGGGMAR